MCFRAGKNCKCFRLPDAPLQVCSRTARILRLQCLWWWHWFWPGLPDVGASVSAIKAFQHSAWLSCQRMDAGACASLAGFMEFPLHTLRCALRWITARRARSPSPCGAAHRLPQQLSNPTTPQLRSGLCIRFLGPVFVPQTVWPH